MAQTRAIEVANANNDFKQANRLRKKLVKFQDTEDEISAHYSNTKLRWTSSWTKSYNKMYVFSLNTSQ
jgi:hypothetical protein